MLCRLLLKKRKIAVSVLFWFNVNCILWGWGSLLLTRKQNKKQTKHETLFDTDEKCLCIYRLFNTALKRISEFAFISITYTKLIIMVTLESLTLSPSLSAFTYLLLWFNKFSNHPDQTVAHTPTACLTNTLFHPSLEQCHLCRYGFISRRQSRCTCWSSDLVVKTQIYFHLYVTYACIIYRGCICQTFWLACAFV